MGKLDQHQKHECSWGLLVSSYLNPVPKQQRADVIIKSGK